MAKLWRRGKAEGELEKYRDKMGKELAYIVFYKNAGIDRAFHPHHGSSFRSIKRLFVEEFAYCPLGVVRPGEPHEIRPRDCTSHGRLLMGKKVNNRNSIKG